MARLCGVLAADSPEAVQLGDGRRAEEFAKLRRQLIASGAVKAIAALAKESWAVRSHGEFCLQSAEKRTSNITIVTTLFAAAVPRRVLGRQRRRLPKRWRSSQAPAAMRRFEPS